MFVCKAWSSVAYEEFHKVLTLNKKSIEIMSPLLLERRFDQWFQGAQYVKELKMHCKVSALHRPPTFDLFTVFLSYLPNLKEIYFSSFKQFEGGYARLLTSAADSQQCLQRIQKVNVQDVMLQMRYYERNFSHTLYFSTYYKLRQSLSHLIIKYPNTDSSDWNFTLDRISGDYIHFLRDFTKLTDLTIYNIMENFPRKTKTQKHWRI